MPFVIVTFSPKLCSLKEANKEPLFSSLCATPPVALSLMTSGSKRTEGAKWLMVPGIERRLRGFLEAKQKAA